MNDAFDISLILPAYNEAHSIERTVKETAHYFAARGFRSEIIVAADGDDGTREIAAGIRGLDCRIRAIGNRTRCGKGRGIREAIAIADGQIVGFADADNKVPIQEFEKIEPWLRQGFHVVVGSRSGRGSVIEKRQPWYRRVGSKGFSVFLHTVVGLPGIRDTQCGFKFFPAPVAKHLFSMQVVDGYMFDVEILLLALRFGYRIKEVPIRWHDDGDSRLELVRGNIRNVQEVLKMRWSLRKLGGGEGAAVAATGLPRLSVPSAYVAAPDSSLENETGID